MMRDAAKKERERLRAMGAHLSTSEDEGGESEGAASSEADGDLEADRLASKLLGEEDDGGHGGKRVEMECDELPRAGPGDGDGEQGEWARRSAQELLSAAGRATRAADQVLDGTDDANAGGTAPFGVMFNPKNFDWTKQTCNVHWDQEARLVELRDKWYGKALVGDGADAVEPSELDPWQKFAHDVVMDGRHKLTQPLRMLLLGSAGTGKSRTVRSFVGSRRGRVRTEWGPAVERARLRGRRRGEAAASAVGRRGGHGDQCTRSVAEMLGVPAEEAAAAVEAFDAAHARLEEKKRQELVAQAEEKASAVVFEEVEKRVRNSCLLAAPTGCASFQLKFGASTLHRAFGVPVGYCGPWKNRVDGRYRKMKTRLDQARLFVLDEMSMAGQSGRSSSR